MTAQTSNPAAAALLARLVGPLSLATQDAVRRCGLAIDAGPDPGAEATQPDAQAEPGPEQPAPLAPSGTLAIGPSPAGSARLPAETGSANASPAAKHAAGTAGIALATAVAEVATAAAAPVRDDTGAVFSPALHVSPGADGGGEAISAPASANLHAVTMASGVDPASSPPAFSGAKPQRQPGFDAAPGQPDAGAATGAVLGIASASRVVGSGDVTTRPALPLARPAPPIAAAVEFGAHPVDQPQSNSSALPTPFEAAHVVVGAAPDSGPANSQGNGALPRSLIPSADGRLRPDPGRSPDLGSGLSLRPAQDVTRSAIDRVLPAPVDPVAAASSAAWLDHLPPRAAALVTSPDLIVAPAPTPAAGAPIALPPAAIAVQAAAAAARPPASMIPLRLAQAPAPRGTDAGIGPAPPAAGRTAIGAVAAASTSSWPAMPAVDAVAARLGRALAPVFDRALAAGSGFDAADEAIAADPPDGPAPTQVSNTFNVKVALGGNASAGDMRQIEDAVADWLRDSARRQGLIG